MKREIKFRAWNKKTHNMGNIITLIYPYGGGFDEVKMSHNGSSIWVKGDEVEIMQYTGLKDRHGVEIYEGDVLRELARVYLKSDGTPDKRYKCRAWDRLVVEWGEYSADDIDLVYGYEYNLCGEFAGWNINKKTAYEIIGNIYENPELLDGGVEK